MHNVYLIMTMSICTMLTRFLPFIIFKKSTSNYLKYLGRVLPPAIIGMLVIYCLKDINFILPPHAIPEIIAVLLVVLLQLKTRNSLISILTGTIIYMLIK